MVTHTQSLTRIYKSNYDITIIRGGGRVWASRSNSPPSPLLDDTLELACIMNNHKNAYRQSTFNCLDKLAVSRVKFHGSMTSTKQDYHTCVFFSTPQNYLAPLYNNLNLERILREIFVGFYLFFLREPQNEKNNPDNRLLWWRAQGIQWDLRPRKYASRHDNEKFNEHFPLYAVTRVHKKRRVLNSMQTLRREECRTLL